MANEAATAVGDKLAEVEAAGYAPADVTKMVKDQVSNLKGVISHAEAEKEENHIAEL